MSLYDKVRFLPRLKELRRFGYSPEYALHRAMEEDAALHDPPGPERSASVGDDGPSEFIAQKLDEIYYEMDRVIGNSSDGAVCGIPGVFRKDGLSIEEMVHLIRQDQAFPHIRNVDDFIDLLHTEIFGTTNMEAQGVPPSRTPLRDEPGTDPSEE